MGCVGVAVILRTGAGLLDAVLDRTTTVHAEDIATGTVTRIEGDRHAPTVQGLYDPADVAALRRLAEGLAAGCKVAGEVRVLRRVETTAARIFAHLHV